jgi:tetratricopeptide (TPR) repeat protein
MIYQQLLHLCAISENDDAWLRDLYPGNDEESLKQRYSESDVYRENEKCAEFGEELSKRWILKTLSDLAQKETSHEKLIKSVLNLKPDTGRVSQEYDETLIYSYFLYFCGILPIIGKEIIAPTNGKKGKAEELKSELDKNLNELKEFFKNKKDPEKIKDRDEALFYNFLEIYIQVVDPHVNDLEVFEELRDCFRNDDNNIIIDAILKEHKILEDIMIKTMSSGTQRRMKRVQEVFPNVGEKQLEKKLKNYIYSTMKSGLARLYFIAGNLEKHQDEIAIALDKDKGYPDNSFALVQHAHLHCMGSIEDRDLNLAEKEFKRVIKLIVQDNQFGSKPAFKYRIELEALLGLAYINYTKGLDSEAERKYHEAESIARQYLEEESDYLLSIIFVNRGRSRLDNRSARSNSDALKDFREVLRIYQQTKIELKRELAEIAALAHNNLGVCYLNEGRYDEAKDEFESSIKLNETSPHARYNLGVLYHKRGEKDRSVALIRNAYFLDPGFKEAKLALTKLNAEKRSGLGAEWFDWWFKNQDTTGRKKGGQRLLALKVITVIAVLLVMITSLGKLSYDLYMHDLVEMTTRVMQGLPFVNTGSLPPQELDENAYLIIFGICIVILLLPFINKLKLGNIEIEVESAGYRPVGPASVTVGLSDQHREDIRYEFFFARFWY